MIPGQRSRGFTLIEVLLAMVISMGVLFAVSIFYYHMAMAWAGHRRDEQVQQRRHTLMASLEHSLCVAPRLISNQNAADPSLKWARLSDDALYGPSYLSWVSEKAPAYLPMAPSSRNLALRCYLRFEPRSGLSLLWEPEDLKMERRIRRDGKNEWEVMQFPLSTEVSRMRYGYYDGETDDWEWIEDYGNHDPGERGIPDAMELYVGENDESPQLFMLANTPGTAGRQESSDTGSGDPALPVSANTPALTQ
jgi:prepilin-type N-terminal cleavage/methylation domain-containing protein